MENNEYKKVHIKNYIHYFYGFIKLEDFITIKF